MSIRERLTKLMADIPANCTAEQYLRSEFGKFYDEFREIMDNYHLKKISKEECDTKYKALRQRMGEGK